MIYTHVLCTPVKGSAECPDDCVTVLEEPLPPIWRVAAIDSSEITAFYQDGITGGTQVVLRSGDQFVVRPGFVEFNKLYSEDCYPQHRYRSPALALRHRSKRK